MADQGSHTSPSQSQPQPQPQPQPQHHLTATSASRSQLDELPDYRLATLSFSPSAPLAAIANLPRWEAPHSSGQMPQFNYPELQFHEQLDHGNIPQHLLEAASLYPLAASSHDSFALQPDAPPDLDFLNSYDSVPRLLRPSSSDEPFLEPAGYQDHVDGNPTAFANWDNAETRSGPLVGVDVIPPPFSLNHYQAALPPSSSPSVELVHYSVPTLPSTLDAVPLSPQAFAAVTQQPPQHLLHSHSAPSLQTPTTPQESYTIPQPFIAIAHYFPTLPQPQPLPSNPLYCISDVHHVSNITGARPLGAFAAVSAAPVALPQARSVQLPKHEPRSSLADLKSVAQLDHELSAKIIKFEKARSKLWAPPRSADLAAVPALNPDATAISLDHPGSSSDQSDDDEDDDTEPSPLPAMRPTDPVDAAEYDVIQAVWHPRSPYVEHDILVARIAQFSELFIKYRDAWRKANEALKKAVEEQPATTASATSNALIQRQIMERALTSAVRYGHAEILNMLGENRKLLAALQHVFLDRAKDGDYNGSLSLMALKLLDRFKNVTAEALEVTKLIKVLSVFRKKGNDEVKDLAKSILDRVSTVGKDAVDSKASEQSLSKSTKPTPVAAGADFNRNAGKSKPDQDNHNSEQGDRNGGGASIASQHPLKARAEINPAMVEGGSTLKRTRGPESSLQGPTTKRLMTALSSKSTTATQSKSTSSTAPASTTRRPTEDSKPSAASSTSTMGSKLSMPTNESATSARPRAAAPVGPKAAPSNFFSSMQFSAAKKQPPTNPSSDSGGASSVAATTASSGPPSAAAAAPRRTFSFNSIMDGILNTKAPEPAPAVPVETRPPNETQEERVRRLRKEARAGVRVSWADHRGKDLVQIRVFSHDPDEEGHDVNLARDVGDVGNEGRMFKQQLHKGATELANEEEVDLEEIFSGAGWPMLSEYEFGVIDAKERVKNFARFAGSKEPESPARAEQEEYEANTLMALYFGPEDVPPCPKSPVNAEMGEFFPLRAFGTPRESTLSRLGSGQQMQQQQPARGMVPSIPDVQALLGRLVPQAETGASQSSSEGAANSSQADSAIDVLKFEPHGDADYDPPPAVATAPLATQPAAAADFGAMLGSLMSQAAAATAGANQQPGFQFSQPAALLPSAWLHQDFNPEAAHTAAATPAFSAEDNSAVYLAALMEQMNASASAMQLQQDDYEYGHRLRQLMQPPPPPPPPPPPQQQQQQQFQQQQLLLQLQQAAAVGPYEHPDRKRAREALAAADGGEDDGGPEAPHKRVNTGADFAGAGAGGAGGAGGGRGGMGSKRPDRGRSRLAAASAAAEDKKFSQPCRFWPEGKCRKGVDCTYRHDEV